MINKKYPEERFSMRLKKINFDAMKKREDLFQLQ